MKQQIFEVSQDSERLILVKNLGPAFEKMLMVCGGALCVSIISWQQVGVPALSGQMPMDIRLLVPVVALGWCVVASTEVYAAWRVGKGDFWIFDRSQEHLQRNGTIKCSFDQLDSIEIVEDKDAGLCHSLLIIPVQGKPITLEDNADGQIDELIK
jgi:hypothetical protein